MIIAAGKQKLTALDPSGVFKFDMSVFEDVISIVWQRPCKLQASAFFVVKSKVISTDKYMQDENSNKN